jgi:hypothetical protein
MDNINEILLSSRIWAENYAEKEGFSEDLTGVCAIATHYLSDELHKANISHKICIFDLESIGHCFIRKEDKIIDITAIQFTIANNPLFNFSKIEIRNVDYISEKHYFWKITTEFDNSAQLQTYQENHDWPPKQIRNKKLKI